MGRNGPRLVVDQDVHAIVIHFAVDHNRKVQIPWSHESEVELEYIFHTVPDVDPAEDAVGSDLPTMTVPRVIAASIA